MLSKQLLDQVRHIDNRINCKMEREIVEDMQRLVRLQMRIAGLIDLVEADTYRTLLQYRYLNNWTREKIADTMHYSIQHIYRLRHFALEHIHKMMR